MLDFNSCTFLGDLDWRPLVDSSIAIFSIARVTRDFVTLHMTFADTLIHLVFLWLLLIVEHGSTLFICGHHSFRFDMAPFCILRDHDIFISYTYVTSGCVIMVMFCIWTCMSQRSVFSDIYPSFRNLHSSLLILDSLLSLYLVVSFIIHFGYHLPC